MRLRVPQLHSVIREASTETSTLGGSRAVRHQPLTGAPRATDTATPALKDGYAGLKRLLTDKSGGNPKALETMADHETDPETLKTPRQAIAGDRCWPERRDLGSRRNCSENC